MEARQVQRRQFILASLAAIVAAACGKARKLAPLPAGSRVLAFGDSVTYGTGAAPGEDWPTRLAALSGWQVANAGLPGDTAEAAQARVATLLGEPLPALVIVELGGNDFLKRRAAAAVKQDLRAIIGRFRQAGVQVVLVAVPELSLLGLLAGKPADAPLYRELASEEGVALVSDVFSDVLGRPELCADRIHPNAEGYRVLAAGIFARLREVGLA
jgi:acyl-CoA hydrolase